MSVLDHDPLPVPLLTGKARARRPPHGRRATLARLDTGFALCVRQAAAQHTPNWWLELRIGLLALGSRLCALDCRLLALVSRFGQVESSFDYLRRRAHAPT